MTENIKLLNKKITALRFEINASIVDDILLTAKVVSVDYAALQQHADEMEKWIREKFDAETGFKSLRGQEAFVSKEDWKAAVERKKTADISLQTALHNYEQIKSK